MSSIVRPLGGLSSRDVQLVVEPGVTGARNAVARGVRHVMCAKLEHADARTPA
jgi:hypothetical protein